MDQDKIREIIYSKCKVYRKEEQNPFEENSVERYSWRIEKTMMDFRIGNLESRHANYASLSDDKIAGLVIESIFKRYFEFRPKARERYDNLKSLPFISE